jgi:hypothetical protein
MPKATASRKPKEPSRPPAVNRREKPSSFDVAARIQDVIFFGFFLLWAWLRIDPRLIFHGGWNIPDFPVFYKGWMFFNEQFGRPGGAVEYLSKYLAQFLVYPLSGAIVITAQALLVTACAGDLLAAFSVPRLKPRLKPLRFIPALIILALYSRYTFHFTVINAMAAAVLFFCLYRRIPKAGKTSDAAVPAVLTVVVYALAGGASLLFALLGGTYKLIHERQWKTGLLFPALGAVIPFAGARIYGVSIGESFSALTPWSERILQFHPGGMALVYGLLACFPLTALAAAIRPAAAGPHPDTGHSQPSARRRLNASRLIETAVLLAALAAVSLLSPDRNLRTILEVDYFAYHRMWSRVLETAGDNPGNDFVMAAVDRALGSTGRLGDSETALRQRPGTLLLNDNRYRFSFWFQFDIFLDLGYINKADHQLTEAMDYYGERPQILRRLALVNMVKGNLGTARIYLGAMGRMPFQGKEAQAKLAALDADSSLSADTEVQSLRASMRVRDGIHEPSFDGLFLELLSINPRNRLAFEYLMMFYLLTLDLDQFVLNLDRIGNFDYPALPRLYEQAILLAGGKPDLKARIQAANLTVSAESRKQFIDFVKILRTARSEGTPDALVEFPEPLKSSYFAYYRSLKTSQKGKVR